MNPEDPLKKNQPASSLHASFFTWKFGFAFFTLFLMMLSIIWMLIRVKPSDREEYRQLMVTFDSNQKEMKSTPYQAKQTRKGIQKDLLFTQNGERMRLRLTAAEAQLVLDRQAEKTEIIEKMNEITCWMQEEFYYLLPDGREAIRQENGKLLIRHADSNKSDSWVSIDTPGLKPMQIMRYMVADKGIYYYKSGTLKANEVTISRFALPGHDLVDSIEGIKPLMSGIAQTIEVFLTGDQLNFKAHQLKATFFTQGRSK